MRKCSAPSSSEKPPGSMRETFHLLTSPSHYQCKQQNLLLLKYHSGNMRHASAQNKLTSTHLETVQHICQPYNFLIFKSYHLCFFWGVLNTDKYKCEIFKFLTIFVPNIDFTIQWTVFRNAKHSVIFSQTE